MSDNVCETSEFESSESTDWSCLHVMMVVRTADSSNRLRSLCTSAYPKDINCLRKYSRQCSDLYLSLAVDWSF